MEENPFKYGKAVTGENFIDREEELKELGSDVLSGQNLIIYSDRRLGKTSLILELFRRMESEEVVSIYIDMYGITSIKGLIERVIGSTVSNSYSQFEKVGRLLKEFLKGLRPKIVLEEGKMSVEVYWEEGQLKNLPIALDLPQKVAEKKGKKIVIAFDEFQEVSNLDGDQIEKMMRSSFQLHDRVSYIFAGSKTHMLKEMFEDGDRAFYNFGKIKILGNIPREEFFDGIKDRFERTGKNIDESIIRTILDITDGHPYYTQQLCHELWYLSPRVGPDEEHVYVALDNIINYRGDHYEQQWSILGSNIQKSLLVALANEDEIDIYSEHTIREYQLKTASHAQKAYESLKSKGLVTDKKIIDIFFRRWILDLIENKKHTFKSNL